MRLRPRHVTPRISLRDNETSTQDRKHRKNEVGQGWAEHGPHNILWSVIIIMGTCEQWPGFPCHDTVSRWQRAELRAKSELSGHWESELWTPGPSSDRSQGRDAGCCGVQWAQNHGVTASQIEERSVSMSDLWGPVTELMSAMAGARLPLCLLMLVTQAMSQAAPCPQGMLAVYRLSLNTHWTQEKFPKQYPQWRPTPQWSKTVGKMTASITMRSISKHS